MSAAGRTADRSRSIAGEARVAPRLVLVDDDERSLVSLAPWLESLGYDVRAFGSARAAIEHVARAGADVVLAGSHAADMSGAQLFASIRDACARRMPALVWLASTSDPVDAMEPGYDAVVRKPCSLDALLHEISRLVQRPRAMPA
jgi:DNA-binding response OmpR family regulator